ncbi:MAG: hypothetical protein V3V02_04655 [Rhizobiaceae bacterium]
MRNQRHKKNPLVAFLFSLFFCFFFLEGIVFEVFFLTGVVFLMLGFFGAAVDPIRSLEETRTVSLSLEKRGSTRGLLVGLRAILPI